MPRILLLSESDFIGNLDSPEGVSISEMTVDEVVSLNRDQVVETLSQFDGVVLQTHPKLKKMGDAIRGSGVPSAWFLVGETDESMPSQTVPYENPDEAIRSVKRELAGSAQVRSEFENSRTLSADYAENLESVVKFRLKSAMYAGDRIGGCNQTWQPDSYDGHIETLLVTLCNPAQSASKATLLDLASCVLAARLTKHFIRHRYSDLSQQSRRSATPPGLSTPTDSFRRLCIGWDGLFTLIFSILDFIIDDDSADFKFSELSESEDWVALVIDRVPDFSVPPLELTRIPNLPESYSAVTQETLLDTDKKFEGKWRYIMRDNEIELQLRVLKANSK